MKTETSVSFVPRSVVLPFVLTVCSLTTLLSGATMVVRPWFIRSFDWLEAHGVGHAGIDIAFRHGGGIAAAVFVAVPAFISGWLLCRPEARFRLVAWFGSLSVLALGTWAAWIGLVMHNTYIALFTN